MSDLSDLAADVAKDLPAQIRKVIDAAIENGWNLNPPGMTLVLRLNHPTDPLAEPVYASWIVGRTPSGRLSFRFFSCSTRHLVPLKGADLLAYLADPTVAYMTPEEAEERDREMTLTRLDKVKWDYSEEPVTNAMRMLGGAPIAIEVPKRTRSTRSAAPPRPAPVRKAAPPLRVAAPKA